MNPEFSSFNSLHAGDTYMHRSSSPHVGLCPDPIHLVRQIYFLFSRYHFSTWVLLRSIVFGKNASKESQVYM